MPRLRLAVALIACLGAGAWAQQPVPGEEANRGLVALLYLQARQAAGSGPALLAPQTLSAIGVDELRPFSPAADQAALGDLGAAFQSALDLPAQTGDSVLNPVRLQIKTGVEEETVAMLARQGQIQQALQWTRLADVPQAPLYGDVIAALSRPHWRHRREENEDSPAPGAVATAAAQAKLLDEVETLVQECEEASGAYPYRGVAEFLRRGTPASVERMLLVQSGYQWAARETDPARMYAAVRFLRQGHRREPELDSLLESTLAVLLHRLAQVPAGDSSYGGVRAAASGLLALLSQLDPLQATGFKQSFPVFDSSARVYEFSPNAFQSGREFEIMPPPSVSLAFTATAPAPDPDLQTTGAERFEVLVAEAEAQRHSHPAQAQALANQASSMLDQQMWPSEVGTAIRLAALYQDLGASADAARMLGNCLDEADREARELDQEFFSGASSQRAAIAGNLNQAAGPVLQIYSKAARLDFTAAAERAETAQFSLLKPLVLARVALVGAIEQRLQQRQQDKAQRH
ncbi:MAG: hypothetical protein ACRD04_12265 [Terriglobales bacterium]